MSNSQNGRLLKEGVQQSLDSFFGDDVDVGGRFIKDDNLTLTHDGTADANELLFTVGEVTATFIDFFV
jgi:hypothetical protein